MEQKRPVIDQPSRCSLLILLPFESCRRSIEFLAPERTVRAIKKEDRGGGKKERGESVREGRSRGIEEGKKKEEKRGMENGGCCNTMTYVIYLKREGIRDDLCCVIWQPALLIIRKMSRFIRSSDLSFALKLTGSIFEYTDR